MINIFTDSNGVDYMTINNMKSGICMDTNEIAKIPAECVFTGAISAPFKTLVRLSYYLGNFVGEEMAYTDMFREEVISFYTKKAE